MLLSPKSTRWKVLIFHPFDKDRFFGKTTTKQQDNSIVFFRVGFFCVNQDWEGNMLLFFFH